MSENKTTIEFVTEDEEVVTFQVIAETRLSGFNYLLVVEADGAEDADEAYIMKEMTAEDDQMVYEMVEDENELQAIADVFDEILEDIDIEQ